MWVFRELEILHIIFWYMENAIIINVKEGSLARKEKFHCLESRLKERYCSKCGGVKGAVSCSDTTNIII